MHPRTEASPRPTCCYLTRGLDRHAHEHPSPPALPCLISSTAWSSPRFALQIPPDPSLLQPSPAALASVLFKPTKAGLPAPSLYMPSPASETFFLSTLGQQILLHPSDYNRMPPLCGTLPFHTTQLLNPSLGHHLSCCATDMRLLREGEREQGASVLPT